MNNKSGIIKVEAGIKSLEKFAFSYTENDRYKCNEDLIKVILPNSLKEIGYKAFACCTKLQEVNIPKNVKIINYAAFFGCRSLKEIVIPDNVKMIERSTFENCHDLKKVVLGKGVKTLYSDAFKSCRNLQEINIHEGIENISSDAFQGCISLPKETWLKIFKICPRAILESLPKGRGSYLEDKEFVEECKKVVFDSLLKKGDSRGNRELAVQIGEMISKNVKEEKYEDDLKRTLGVE